MTEQCPLCGKEKTDGQDYCVTSGCGWHFRNDASLNLIPTPEHSYVQSEEKWEENKKEMQKEQEPPKSEPEFFKGRDEKVDDDSFVQSESQWEKERKEMGEKGSRDFHFNVNVRTNTGSIARLTTNEEPFLRAMEIQERKREKIEEEQKRL